MRVVIVSDLHIRGADDPLCASLARLARDEARPGDRLVLAGDVFDLFVGDKPLFRTRYRELLGALAQAGARGVVIDSIEGNHDFHLERAFAEVPGLTVHPHHVRFTAGGRRFHVEHGDTIDRTDTGYLVLRAFFRSPVMKGLVAALPGEWLDAVGTRASHASGTRHPRLPSELEPARLARLRAHYRRHAEKLWAAGDDFVVLGHCHDLDGVSATVGGRAVQYLNVGYPRVHGTYVRYDSERDGEGLTRVPMPGYAPTGRE
jgi:UDP-2,3-diacylglucosamine hydrolase